MRFAKNKWYLYCLKSFTVVYAYQICYSKVRFVFGYYVCPDDSQKKVGKKR